MNFQSSPVGMPMPYHGNAGSVKKLKITKLLIIETGTYEQQYLRPYQVDLRQENTQALREVISGKIESRIVPVQLSGLANRLVCPTAQPEGTIDIPNSWSQKRYRFMMELTYDRDGYQNVDMILGYTNYDGVSINSGSIDPKMVFYVNSIINIRRTVTPTATGLQPANQISYNAHVLQDPNWNNRQSPVMNNTAMYHMRPTDIFTVTDTLELADSDITTCDVRLIANNKPVLAGRNNNIASHYAASILDSYNNATRENYGDDSGTMITAAGYCRDALTSQNTFLNKLYQLKGTDNASFTYNDLLNIDPDVAFTKHIIHFSNAQRSTQLHQQGQSEYWHGSNIETKYATILGQAVPALMVECGLTKIQMVSTNNISGTQPLTRMIYATAFGGADVTVPSQRFISRFDIEIVRDLSYNNEIGYQLECSFDLTGESKIGISLEGRPIVEYVVPQFADALVSPMTTITANRPQIVCQQFTQMFNILDSERARAHQMPNATLPINTAGAPQFNNGTVGLTQQPLQTPVGLQYPSQNIVSPAPGIGIPQPNGISFPPQKPKFTF